MGQALKKSSQNAGANVIRQAILFIGRTNVRTAVKQELKNAGLQALLAETQQDCLQHLSSNPNAMFITEWRDDGKEIAAVLKAAQGRYNVDTRPIYLITSDINEMVVAAGLEYNVSRLHSGEISKTTIMNHLQSIIQEEGSVNSLKPSLARVAEARSKGDWPTSGIILRELRSIYPKETRLIVELADNFIQEERWEEATALLQPLVKRDDLNLRAKHLLARCMMKEKKFAEATKILQDANLINPYNVDRLVDLGNSLLKIHRIQEATASFDLALQLDQTSRPAKLGKSQCILVDGDVNEALNLLKQISGPRELASVFNNAAILSIHQGKFESGINLYKSAIGAVGKRQKLVARLMFNMGIGYHKWGNIPAAFECFEKAAKFDTAFDSTLHNASILANQLGKKMSVALSDATQPHVVEVSKGDNKDVIAEFSDDLSSEDEGLLG